MWNIAGRTAESENLNEELERRVVERTGQLEAANRGLEKEVVERKIEEAKPEIPILLPRDISFRDLLHSSFGITLNLQR